MRLKALEIFTRGKPYFELIGQPGDGLSAEEVAQEVSELMGIMEPTYLQDSSDTGDKAQHYLLSAGFLVAAANGVIEKSEVNALAEILGPRVSRKRCAIFSRDPSPRYVTKSPSSPRTCRRS